MPALYDAESAWNFCANDVYPQKIENNSNIKPKLEEYLKSSTYKNYDKCFDTISNEVYGAYEKYRSVSTTMALDVNTIAMEVANINNRMYKVGSGVSGKWNVGTQNTNIWFWKANEYNDTSGRCARISVQLNVEFIRKGNLLNQMMEMICSSLDAVLIGNTKTNIKWKFVSDKSIGDRIDDIVIYVGSESADQTTREAGKLLSTTLDSYVLKNTKGIPGMVKCVDGIYLCRECNGHPTRWYSQVLKDTLNIGTTSHGGTLGNCFAIALLDSKMNMGPAKGIFVSAFGNYRSLNNCFEPMSKQWMTSRLVGTSDEYWEQIFGEQYRDRAANLIELNRIFFNMQ